MQATTSLTKPAPSDAGGRTALVLGGGGVSGIAWMIGLIAGLADEGVDLRSAGLMIGTSAGATVGAQLRSGLSTEQLFARQVDPDQQAREISPPFRQLMAMLEAFRPLADISDPLERRRRIGRIALDSQTVSEAERRAIIAGRLASLEWPAQPLQFTAIDAESGELCIIDADAGVALVDAVAASCAVPGIWPPVTIAGRRYIDGGVRTADNADLATGNASVVILSPIGGVAQTGAPSTLTTETVKLKDAGATAIAVEPEPEARSAMGLNALDPSTRAAAAQAGRAQGRREANKLADWATRAIP
ncbi:MAG: patatin-like phospholipase family protein [Alphaproteobacteria bacterium]